MMSRREFLDFLKATCAVAALPTALTRTSFAQETFLAELPLTDDRSEAVVNDIHSQLNATRVSRVIKPLSSSDLRATILTARAQGKAISISGGRHSMGAQQFGTGTILVDMTEMNRVLNLDAERGIVEVEAGIEWPQLLDHLMRVQTGRQKQWGIVQKQTGADRLSIGGALASNVHGRGLKFKPIIDQVDSFTLMDHTGAIVRCSRDENSAPVSAGHWRLRSVRNRDVSAAAVVGTQEGAANSRDSRHERHHSVLRAANRGWVLVRRLPVRDRQQPRQLSAARSLLVLSPG